MQIERLLGKDSSSVEVSTYLSAFPEGPEVLKSGTDLYYSYPKFGLTCLFRENKLHSLMFYSEGRDNFSQFQGELVFDLSFSDNYESVQAKVGSEGGAVRRVKVPFPGRRESNWVRFSFGSWRLHIEFKSRNLDAIGLITISAVTPEDGLQ
jgi:hypothetical protein